MDREDYRKMAIEEPLLFPKFDTIDDEYVKASETYKRAFSKVFLELTELNKLDDRISSRG